MKSLKETVKHLQDRGQPFDVVVVKDGKETKVNAKVLMPSGDIENYIKRQYIAFDADQIFIQERQKMGNTVLRQGQQKFDVDMKDNIPAAPAPAPVNPYANPYQGMNGLPAAAGSSADYIINDLREKVGELKGDKQELKGEIKELKGEIVTLTRKNDAQTLTINTWEKEKELDMRQMEIDKKGALDGLAQDPQVLGVVAQIGAALAGKMLGTTMQGLPAAQPSDESQGGAPSGGETVQEKCGESIYNWIVAQDEKMAQAMYVLVNKVHENPALMDQFAIHFQ